MLVEAERLRPHLETLLADADFVSTSAKFPQVGLEGSIFFSTDAPYVHGLL